VFITGFTDVESDFVRRTILIPTFVAAKDVVLVVLVIVDLARIAVGRKTVTEVGKIGERAHKSEAVKSDIHELLYLCREKHSLSKDC
jgi:hypothetical protein